MVFWAAVMDLILYFNIPTSPLSADFIKQVVSSASELLFMQKLCRIFIARKSKYSMKQALMLSMAILFCAVPTVMGMQGGEIQWAQQSLIADVVNLGGEMAINYLSKKQKVLGQVGCAPPPRVMRLVFFLCFFSLMYVVRAVWVIRPGSSC